MRTSKKIINNDNVHVERIVSTKKYNLDYKTKSKSFDDEAKIFITKEFLMLNKVKRLI